MKNEILLFCGRGDVTDRDVAAHFGMESRVHEVMEQVDALIAEGKLAEIGLRRLPDTAVVVRTIGLPRVVGGSVPQRTLDAACRWMRCTRCALSGVRKNVVYARGSVYAKAMAIEFTPTEEEDARGMAMYGDPAYAAIMKAVQGAGFTLDAGGNLLACSLVACMPRDSAVGLAREPRTNEIDMCRPHVQELLDIVQPRVVILMGKEASKHFFDRPPEAFPFWRKGVCFVRTHAATDIALRPELLKEAIIEWRLAREMLTKAMERPVAPMAWVLPFPP